MTQRTALYRHFDASGRLLYVGMSLSAVARLEQHLNASDWGSLIARVDIEYYPSRETASEAEQVAIRAEHPVYNVMHTAEPANQIAAVVSKWPSRRAFRRDVSRHGANIELMVVHIWCSTGEIPRKHWGAVLAAANDRGIALSADDLCVREDAA